MANVPFFHSLSEVYDSVDLEEQTKRYSSLYNRFVELYNAPPSHIVRAPGRVNLIVIIVLKCLMQG
jgi:Galactokinase galactose-binding signature